MIADFTLSIPSSSTGDADFVSLLATVACRGFSGHTAFTIARRDIDRFLADASNLSTPAADSAQLLGGWDDSQERMRLRITRAGLSGQFTARVRIASTGPREDQWNRVETEFVCPPAALAAFLSDLTRLVARHETTTASLGGDSEAIA
jgi:hypothetical protein